VVYVDFDPIVVSHSAARRTTAPGLDTIMADAREPAAVLKNPRLTALIDFDEPVGMVMFSVLHSIADDEDPGGNRRSVSRPDGAGQLFRDLALLHAQ